MMKNEPQQEAPATPEIIAALWSQLYSEDAGFRAEFDKDPKVAISKLLGREIPADIEIVVHRKKPGQIHVVLPESGAGLSDEQMDAISGGIRGIKDDGWGGYRPVYDRQGRPW